MATGTLTGQTIANTYKSLLKITGTTAGGETLHATTLKIIEDGDGNPTPIQLAQNRIEIVPTANHANAFEVSQADGTQILNINSTTPSVLVAGSGTKLYFNDASGEYISGDGTDLTITSGNDIVLALGSTGSVYHTGDGGSNNTIYGYQSGIALASGGNNTLIGNIAGNALSNGGDNVAIGYQALRRATTSADENVAIGRASMEGDFGTADINGCVAVGYDTLSGTLTSNAIGTIAIGLQACKSITSGADNIAIGYQALDALTVGSRNIAVGRNSLTAAATASGQDDNVAIGYNAMATANDQDNLRNIAIGSYTLDATAGNEHHGSIAIGHQSLGASTTGIKCTAVGYYAGNLLTTGGENTLIGHGAMDGGHVDNDGNTAIGVDAMGGSAGGSRALQNVAIGNYSMDATLNAANYNVAVGYLSLTTLDTADLNVAVGYKAGEGITGGGQNVCIGAEAGRSITTANDQVMIGYRAGGEDAGNAISGGGNTVIGKDAGYNLEGAANSNCFIGKEAGDSCTTGTNNVIVGEGADLSAATGSNQIIFGNNSAGQGDNTVMLGNSSVDSTNGLFCYDTGIASPSDKRIKKDIEDSIIGLDFIKSLRTVTYQRMHESEWPDEIRREDANYKPASWEEKTEVGLISQEVKAVMDEMSIDMQGHSVTPSGTEHIKYVAFVTPLIKAVQELSAKVEELESKLK